MKPNTYKGKHWPSQKELLNGAEKGEVIGDFTLFMYFKFVFIVSLQRPGQPAKFWDFRNLSEAKRKYREVRKAMKNGKAADILKSEIRCPRCHEEAPRKCRWRHNSSFGGAWVSFKCPNCKAKFELEFKLTGRMALEEIKT
jgi:DNA-directed RNA polymerase subunit RPC12/RpoP